ncbi:hypothetical protein EPN18_09970 [bacterium]|nr:MAG: hypothetical protein EPN18_09970 [bacterium]
MGSGFQNTSERMLPPRVVNGRILKPKVTASNGIRQDFHAPRKGRENHGGVDVNYHHDTGNSLGQNGINLEHPAVGSPVTGKVTKRDPTGMGMITIKDLVCKLPSAG